MWFRVLLSMVQVEARECTFSPDREAMDVGGAAAGLGESRLERWERLAYQDWQRVQAARAASASQHYSQFTFQPHIDPHSRRIGQVTEQLAVPKLHRVLGTLRFCST